MKRLTSLLCALALLSLSQGDVIASTTPNSGDFQGCPERGQGGDPEQNILKNRSFQVSTPQSMTVAQINSLPVPNGITRKDRQNWPSSALSQVTVHERQGAVVTAYLIGAKQQGVESTNCKMTALRDYHVWIVDNPSQDRDKSIVIEVSPRWLASNPGWNIKTLSKLATQKAKVRITGWLMLDPEHPDQIGKTRGGLWELHPITKIEVFNGGRWVEL